VTARVLVSQYVFPEAVAALREAGLDVVARLDDVPLSAAELRRAVAGADALVCLLSDRIDCELLAAAPRLGLVANVAVGYDNVDVDAATVAGVAVSNTPGVLTEATADLAFALILATARRIPEGDAFLRAGRYTHWTLDQEQVGADVHGQVLGIFGLGRIGRAVARRASGGFGMRVIYHSSRRLPAEQEQELGVGWVELDELLSTSDFLSLHGPLTEQTRHVIDARALARMRPSATLVNTARGPLVDEAALAAGAGGRHDRRRRPGRLRAGARGAPRSAGAARPGRPAPSPRERDGVHPTPDGRDRRRQRARCPGRRAAALAGQRDGVRRCVATARCGGSGGEALDPRVSARGVAVVVDRHSPAGL